MKLATRTNARIIQGAGVALMIASAFQPRHSPLEAVFDTLSIALIYGGLAVHTYLWGRDAGRREALRVEITRVWSAQQPFAAKTFREAANTWSGNLTDVEPKLGVPDERMWGTDCWGEIESEPNEDHARSVAQSSGTNLYSRYPHCEWQIESLKGADQ